MKPKLPNLIVIGAMKCGTTSLHDYLNQHPDIFMSKVKEIDYFVKEFHWEDGVEWYRAQFDSDKSVRGESSQNYTKRHHFEPGVVDRISDTLSEVRFVYLVRDPIERIVSHYHEALEGGYAPPEGMNGFLANAPQENHYVLTSSYHYQLLPYVERFGMECIHVTTLEDLKLRRLETMNRIFSFVGVEQLSDNAVFDFLRNSGSEKRARNAFGKFAFGPASSGLRALLPRSLKDRLKSSRLSQKAFTNNVEREYLQSELADRLRDVLRPDMERFRALTGLQLDEWSV